MVTSVESSSPCTLNKQESTSFMGSSPMFSPSSDKRFWSSLRNRVDTLLENQKPIPIDQFMPTQQPINNGVEDRDRAKRLKEDSLLLLRGFDSVSDSLSQLSNNLENALQGARDLARPPTLSEIVHSTLEDAKSKEKQSIEEQEREEDDKEEGEEGKRGLKRKINSAEFCEDQSGDAERENGQSPKELGKIKKAKNIAISIAKKAASLAKEVKSIKSDLCFMQERCTLLEEENRRLRDGFAKGIRPEEDDLVRLQMEALLAEKSRLANENASLTRENQCLHQLVEYHQLTSQEFSESYEHVMRGGMCLDFSSPIPEEDDDDIKDRDSEEALGTPRSEIYKFSAIYDEEEQ